MPSCAQVYKCADLGVHSWVFISRHPRISSSTTTITSRLANESCPTIHLPRFTLASKCFSAGVHLASNELNGGLCAVDAEGTHAYAHPDALAKLNSDESFVRLPQHDLWSLGITLLEMCHGALPWEKTGYARALAEGAHCEVLSASCLGFSMPICDLLLP